MNRNYFLTVALSVLLISAPVYSGSVPDRLIGKVAIPNSAKLDIRAKKELAAIAAKINKSRQKGVIKIKGDVPSAASADEYIVKAAFLASNVEAHLKPLLLKRYQVYITASKYSGEKSAGQNSVEIALYPHELQDRYNSSTLEPVTSEVLPTERNPVYEQPAQPVYRQPAQSGLLTPPQDADAPVETTSKKERGKREPDENPALANELVLRAKARAAEKAKRLQQSN